MEQYFNRLRQEFPILSRKVYLNSGSYCALSNDVKAAFDQYMDDRLAVGANWDVWITKNEAVRVAMAKVLRAHPDEIAVTASASAGINAIASALDFTGSRNKIVVSDFEFPTNAQIWHAQEKRGARVAHVPVATDGYIPLESFEKAIDDTTQLVAVTHVCFRNGARLDIGGIVEIARRKGAKVLLDCYQSVGALTVDVKALGVDFAVGGMLKYLLGTAGIGFLYVKGDLVPTLVPTTSGWFAQADIQAMDITANNPSPSARRFEAGTPPVSNCYAAEAGLNMIVAIGTDVIEERNRMLTRRCMDKLEELGWPSVTPADERRRGPLIALPSSNAALLMQKLMDADIVPSYRGNNVRLGFHFYNNEDDIDRLIEELARHRDLQAA